MTEFKHDLLQEADKRRENAKFESTNAHFLKLEKDWTNDIENSRHMFNLAEALTQDKKLESSEDIMRVQRAISLLSKAVSME